jgi:F0F1-type ATP synthase assembly protein I
VNVRERKPAKGFMGYGDGFSDAFSLVLTPVLLGIAGYFLDGEIGTRPIFTVVLAIIGVVGAVVTAYYRYTGRIDQMDEGKPWTR